MGVSNVLETATYNFELSEEDIKHLEYAIAIIVQATAEHCLESLVRWLEVWEIEQDREAAELDYLR